MSKTDKVKKNIYIYIYIYISFINNQIKWLSPFFCLSITNTNHFASPNKIVHRQIQHIVTKSVNISVTKYIDQIPKRIYEAKSVLINLFFYEKFVTKTKKFVSCFIN